LVKERGEYQLRVAVGSEIKFSYQKILSRHGSLRETLRALGDPSTGC